MALNRDDSIPNHEPISSPVLAAHFASIGIEDKSEKNIADVGRGRFVIVYIDEQKGWKFKNRSSSSPLRWHEDYRVSFRPSSGIKIEVFRKSMLSVMFPNKQHLIGRFSGKLVELLENDAALDMIDETGAQLDDIKIKIKLTLVSDSPRDLMGRVDAAISRLDDSVFSQISKQIDMFAPMTKLGHSSAQAVYTCIPSLGRTFQAIVNIARTFGDTHPILKISCTILFSVYEALKDEAVLSEAVRGLAESLREMVHAAHKCPDLLVIDGTENVIEEIGRVSMQIACLIDEYARWPSAVRSMRDALSDDMKTRVDFFQARCRDLRTKFSNRLELDTNQTVHQIHTAQMVEQLKGIMEWLKAPDPSRNYNSARARHQKGTGTWFVSGEKFSKWKERAGSLLWVHGIPGCGKTILCSSTIECVTMHCADNPSSAIAYFFFDSRDAQDGLQRHEGLVRCLIKQLSLQCHGIPHGLEELLGCGNAQPSEESLHAALELLLVTFEQAYVVIDSLDECTERSSVLGWLQRLTRWEVFQHKIHILVTSRDELDIRQCLESLEAVRVCVQGKLVDDDIRSYIDHALQTGLRMKKWNDATKEEIRENVLAVSGGMFRLAALQLEELRNCCNLRELRKRLAKLPRSLYETYDRVLLKVDEEYRQPALRILQWLAFSARLPRLNELTEVLAVDLETKPHPRLCDDLRYDSEDVLFICSNLIIISAEGNVQLAHLSVKEYLLTSASLQKFGFTANERLSHSMIAQTCLAYLLQFDTLEILNEDTLNNFPLAHYAAEHWVYHAQSGASDSDADPLQALMQAFFTGNDAPFISWVRLSNLDDPGSKHDMRRMPIGSRLYYACLAGLQDMALALLDAGENPNVKGLDNMTVLQVASRDGQHQVVQNLLEKGAEVNTEGGWSGPALRVASARGHEEIVRLLLEHGADINMQGIELNHGSALQAASSWGHEGVVRLLLEKGAGVNMIGGLYGSALQAAVIECHEGVVRLLVDHGAEVDIKGGMYCTALHEASEHGHINIVRFLLERGANVDMPGGRYNTALQAASQGGHEDIVRLLLENGADVGNLGGRFGSVLQAAASGGERSIEQRVLKICRQEVRGDNAAVLGGSHTDIVRLLLEKGAQVNVPLGGYYGSALRGASLEGNRENVQLLLEKGAEVNIENERYGTALQAAALEGHEEVVRLLLANGAEVNMPQEPRGSALQAAASGGHESIVQLLLEKGAEITKRSQEYGDALQAASTSGHEHIVQLLLESGADINARGLGRYKSALQAASRRNHQAIVELLLEKGAMEQDDGVERTH